MAQETSSGMWGEYLHGKESIVSAHRIGFYDVATTGERVMLVRRFLKSYMEVRYEDIHSLSHRTRPRWPKLFRAAVGLLAGYYAYTISPLKGSTVLTDFLSTVINTYLGELKFLPMAQAASAIAVLSVLYGLLNLLKFIPTLQGVFIIKLKSKSPIRISASLTHELREVMKDIEAGMSEASKPKTAAAPAPVPPQTEPRKEAGEDVFENIRTSITEAREDAIILIRSKSENHMKSMMVALESLVKDAGRVGVYIALSKPYSQVIKEMTQAGIPTENVLFIDAISYMTGETPQKKEGVAFIENPSSLEEVGMHLDTYVGKNKPSFVFFDSLDSLLIYNDETTVRQFTHYLINKLRIDNLGGVILALEKEGVEDLIKTIIPLCDKEIKV